MEEKDSTIYINSQVNEVFATTELTQYFTNTLDKSIELSVSFPIKDEISLSKFVIQIENKIVISKIMSKEKAEEKYNDTIASGNTGFISKYKEKEYTVNIGNLEPNQQIKLISIFIQMIGTQDMSYEFSIMEKYPVFHYEEKDENKLKNKMIKANFEIKTLSKITRLIAPFMDEEAKKNSIFKVDYSPDYKLAKIYYTKNPDDIKIINRNSGNEDLPTFYSSFSILFRTELMNNPILYYEYNPEFKETAYSINYIYTSKNLKQIPIPEKPDEDNTISYSSKYEQNLVNETPGLFVFLIDQSGSMSGKSIDLVKQALMLFIKSLPPKSYFQLIGFGSRFKKYNEEPVEYNKENVKNILEVINDLKADLGGTNISSPLKAIYYDKCYDKINLSKHIFLLTDGQVDNREQCIDIITTNSSKFKVHSIGIGNDFDKILIERCGKVGNGSSSFVEDVENINSIVIDILNKCLRAYLVDINFELLNYKDEFSSKIIETKPIRNFTYQNEIINYSFILPLKTELKNLKIKFTAKDPINIIESEINIDNMIQLDNGEEMSKMIIGKALKFNPELINDENNEIKFAKKYQILSKNTALFAEILNNKNQQSELIKVNINDYSNEINDDEKFGDILRDIRLIQNNLFQLDAEVNIVGSAPSNVGSALLSCNNSLKCCYDEDYEKPKKKKSIFSWFGGNKKEKKSKKESVKNIDYDEDISDNLNIINEEKDSKINVNKIIMEQDIMDGYWDENNETKKIIDILGKEKFNKIKNKVNGLYKGDNEIKIIYTILVLYYFNEKCKEKLNELILIINKANKYLENNGIKYTDIISNL